MKKASSGRNLDANLETMPIWEMVSLICPLKLYICQDPRIYRAYTAQNTKKKTNFPLVSLSVYPRSRRGAKSIRQGEERWRRPPKTVLEQSYLTKNSSSENRMPRPRQKKTPDRIHPKKLSHIYFMHSVFDGTRYYAGNPGHTRAWPSISKNRGLIM